jgi:hypothetical protein
MRVNHKRLNPVGNGVTLAEVEDLIGRFLHVYDEKTAGTDGGTATSGSWELRTLNTVGLNNITGASLASNQITLPAGTYFIDAIAPTFNTGSHKARLYDTTAAAAIFYGTTESSAGGNSSSSTIRGQFTLSVQSVLEIQHRVTTTNAGDGYGANAGFSVVERYTDVVIQRTS